jgi:hypothetical protein
MLDDLRNSSNFIDDEEQVPNETKAPMRTRRKRQSEMLLGMTAQQRFILSLMLLMMVCVLGVFGLAISGSIILPF